MLIIKQIKNTDNEQDLTVHYHAIANFTLPPTHVLLHLCQLQYCYEVAFKILKLRVVITVSLLLTGENVVERTEFYPIFMTQRVFHGLSFLSPNLALCSVPHFWIPVKGSFIMNTLIW